jgi:hypothetical protein
MVIIIVIKNSGAKHARSIIKGISTATRISREIVSIGYQIIFQQIVRISEEEVEVPEECKKGNCKHWESQNWERHNNRQD